MKTIHRLSFVALFTLVLLPFAISASDYTQWQLPEGATARFGKGWINDIVFSPSGNFVSVATTIGVWTYDVHTGTAVNLFTGNMGGSNAISYSSDGTFLASAHWDRRVHLWNVSATLPITPYYTFSEHPGPIYAVAISPNNRMIASGGAGGTLRGDRESNGLIRIWDFGTEKQLISVLPYPAPVSTLAFSPNSRWIAGGCGDGTIRVWDAGTGKRIHEFKDYKEPVWKVGFSPDNQWLLIVSMEGTCLLRNLVNSKRAPINLQQHGSSIRVASFSPTESPEGYTLATGSTDKQIWLWQTDLSNTEDVSQNNPPLEGHDDSIWILEFSKDGQNLASGSLDGTLRFWDLDLRRERLQIAGHTGGIKTLTYTEDNRILACGTGLDGLLRLWDAGTSGQLSILLDHVGMNKAVTFSNSGGALASAGAEAGTLNGTENETILLSDVPEILRGNMNNSLLKSVKGNRHGITALALSASVGNRPGSSVPKTLASGGKDARIHLIDVTTGRELRTLTGAESTITALAFTPDSTSLLSGEANGTVRVWEALSGAQKSTYRNVSDASITALAFSPFSRFFAVGDALGKIRLYDFNTTGPKRIFTQHTREITTLVFAADGNTLVSGSEDGTILMWDPNAAPSNSLTPNKKTQQPSRKLKPTAKGDIQKALDATVFLVTQDRNGNESGSGSGFFVRPGYIATNYHVIDDAARTSFKLVGTETSYWIDRVAATDPAHDLALLKVSGVNVSELSLIDSDKVRIGEEIYAVGNPLGLEGTVSDGIVSGIRGEDNNKWIQITAPISPGNSGGPVINSKGEVIGIASRGYKADYGQNLNFAVPANYLKTLLRKVQ